MRTRNSIPAKRKSIAAPVIIFVFATLLFSCKKNVEIPVNPKSNLAVAAKLLDGELVAGNITSESNENELALNYNNNSKIILITKIADAETPAVDDIRSPQMIISKYGIVLSDLSNNKILFLINNDPESLKKFEAIQSLFKGNFQRSLIFGTTIINSEKV